MFAVELFGSVPALRAVFRAVEEEVGNGLGFVAVVAVGRVSMFEAV